MSDQDDIYTDEDLNSILEKYGKVKRPTLAPPRRSKYDPLIEKHAAKYGVDPDLVRRVITQESSGNPNARSLKNAQGLMQLIPDTARAMGVTDPYDPDQNIMGGVKYLRQQLDTFGDPKLALAAYNAGPGRVRQYKGIPPFKETRDYVSKIGKGYTGTGYSAQPQATETPETAQSDGYSEQDLDSIISKYQPAKSGGQPTLTPPTPVSRDLVAPVLTRPRKYLGSTEYADPNAPVVNEAQGRGDEFEPVSDEYRAEMLKPVQIDQVNAQAMALMSARQQNKVEREKAKKIYAKKLAAYQKAVEAAQATPTVLRIANEFLGGRDPISAGAASQGLELPRPQRPLLRPPRPTLRPAEEEFQAMSASMARDRARQVAIKKAKTVGEAAELGDPGAMAIMREKETAERNAKMGWGEAIGARAKSGLATVNQSLIDIPASTMEAIGIATALIPGAKKYGGIQSARDTNAYQMGQALREFAKEKFPEDPRFQDEFLARGVPQALGSSLGFFGGGAVGTLLKSPKFVIGLLGGTSGMASGYRDAKNHGASENQAFASALLNGGVGVSEIFPLANMLNRFDRQTGGSLKRGLVNAGKEGFEEGLQEFFQSTAGNHVARQIYDKNRDLFQGTAAATGTGGVTGAVLSFLISAATKGKGRAQGAKQVGDSMAEGKQTSPTSTVEAQKPVPEIGHALFGKVRPVENQAGVPSGKVRVEEVANPESVHVIKKVDGRGAGNQLAVPIRTKAQPVAPVPESPETLNAQMAAMQEGRRPAVLVTEGEQSPIIPKGFTETQTKVGKFIHPESIKPEEIKQSVADDTYAQKYFGIVNPQANTQSGPAVIARDQETGKEIQAAAVETPQEAVAQAQEFAKQHPQAVIEPTTAERVKAERQRQEAIIAQRVAAIRPEVREGIDSYLDEIGKSIEDATSSADTRQHRDFTQETAGEIEYLLKDRGVDASPQEIEDALYALRHQALPDEFEPAKPAQVKAERLPQLQGEEIATTENIERYEAQERRGKQLLAKNEMRRASDQLEASIKREGKLIPPKKLGKEAKERAPVSAEARKGTVPLSRAETVRTEPQTKITQPSVPTTGITPSREEIGTGAAQSTQSLQKQMNAIDWESRITETEEKGARFKSTGIAAVECFGSACEVRNLLGKERTKIYGFSAKENPASELSQGNDGHDFAIVDGRFIVDPWLQKIETLSDRSVFDLTDPEDKASIKRFYGDRSTWKEATKAPYKPDAPQLTPPIKGETHAREAQPERKETGRAHKGKLSGQGSKQKGGRVKSVGDREQRLEGREEGKVTPLIPKGKTTSVPVESLLKEPWEMTADEWRRARSEASADISGMGYRKGSNDWSRVNEISRLTMGLNPIERGQQRAVYHSDVVKEAVRQGKLVPAEVLAEYPNLTKPQAKAAKSGVEERFSGFPILRSLFSDKPRYETVRGLTSESEEVEARWQAAKGIKPPSIFRKAKEGLQGIGQAFKRHFPHLNPNKDSRTALTVDILRQYEASPSWAKAVAFDNIVEITGNLDKRSMDLFTRNLVLPDIIKDIEEGKYANKELPFGYKDKSQVERDLKQFREIADKNPPIGEALKKRNTYTKSLTKRLVDLALLPKEVLDDSRYFHRQVMKYVNDPAFVGTGSQDVRMKQKGFQKGRTGGGDFNTLYQEAEFEWVSQAYSLIARKEALDRIQQVNDIKSDLQVQAKAWNKLNPENPKTWKDLVPETHTIWQPEKGNHFFMASSVEESILDKALKGEQELKEKDIRKLLAMGGPKEQWVIPSELATTLNEFRAPVQENPLEQGWVFLQSTWKQWVLLNPLRALKYNINNMSGDLDIALAYDPKMLGFYKKAASDLWRYQILGKGSPELKAEISAAMKKGVVDSGLSVSEIPDINKSGAFGALAAHQPNIIAKGVQMYWGATKNFTNWRENILRLAAYRYFQKEVAKGKPIYAASTKSQVDAISDPNDKAAKLARELIGDYGNVSHAGQWLRRHMMPFYSWTEINAPRYVRLFANLAHEDSKARTVRTAGVIGKRIVVGGAKLGLKVHILFLLAALWNRTQYPEEEKQIRKEGRKNHLIFGRNEDGSVRSFRVEGAFADALEWFGSDDYITDIMDVKSGKSTIQDKLAEAVKAPIERLINSQEPITKTTFELASGRSTFPSIFEKGSSFKMRSTPIRDRWEHLSRTVSLDKLYRKVTGKPEPPTMSGPLGPIASLLLYRTDPGEAAFFESREKAMKWAKDKGKEIPSMDSSEKSDALFYFKQATKWKDEKAADKWLKEYQRLGGTEKGMEQSLERSHPLGGLAKKEWGEYLGSLSPNDMETFVQAVQWYNLTYGKLADVPGTLEEFEQLARIAAGEAKRKADKQAKIDSSPELKARQKRLAERDEKRRQRKLDNRYPVLPKPPTSAILEGQ